MIPDNWKRVAGIRCQDDGSIAAVWMARDPDTDVVHLYDACLFAREVLAVIAEGLNCRGRGIPIAWDNKEIADRLLERGCNMLPEAAPDTDAMAEATSREIWERMRSGRFKVERRLSAWLDEYKTFNRTESKVPRDTHPLMAATRHAISQIEYARAERAGVKKKAYPKVAIV